MGDDVTSWMDCLYYYYLVGGATLPIFLVHGCEPQFMGVLTLCLLVHSFLIFGSCPNDTPFVLNRFRLITIFKWMKSLLVPEYHKIKYTKKVRYLILESTRA